jgi:ArsR family transcriptional regulator, nickel/cobalt-responsive transcriptional repressor
VTRRHKVDFAAVDGGTARVVAATMQALATPSRVRILACVATRPRAVSELADELDMEQPAVSQQLRVLRELGLVVGDRKGRRVIYALRDDHVAALLVEAIGHAQHLGVD